MADEDRWDDRRYRDQDRDRYRACDDNHGGRYQADYSREHSYGRPRGDRGGDRGRDHEDHRFAPFGTSGPVAGRGGTFDDHGEPFGAGRHPEPRRQDYARRSDSDYTDERSDFRRFGQPHDYNATGASYGRPDRSDYRGRDRGEGMEDRARNAGREARSWWDRATEKVSSMMGDDDDDRHRYAAAPQGEHRGRGPKGYRRSDDRIREDVSDRLTEDPYLDASEIEVQVSDSEVTLTGFVRQRDDRRRAENLAEAISGVTHVQNNLRVQASDQSQTRPLGGPGVTPF
jgi:osmotically-inducible protein OsmY